MSRKKQSTNFSWGQIAKKAITCSVSWQLAKLLGSAHPYLAPLSVILCMKSTAPQSVQFSFHRFVGTVLGTAVIWIAVKFTNVPNFWSVGIFIFAGFMLVKALRRNQIVLEQAALTILLVLVFEHKSGNYIVDRLRDTGIGILLTLLVQLYILPINYKKEIKKIASPFTSQLSGFYLRAADWVMRGCNKENGERLKQDIQSFTGTLQHSKQSIDELNQSLKFYPFSAQSQKLVKTYRENLRHWGQGLAFLDGTVSSIARWHSSGHMTDADRTIWSKQLADIGSYFNAHAKVLDAIKNNKVNNLDSVFVNPISLHVGLPEHIDPQPYNIALYQDTVDLIRQLT